MEDIRSWWQVPSIAHFCSLFRTAFGLTDFEIEDLEEALLSDGTVDGETTLNSTFLGDLHARLLRGLFETNDIHADNFEPFLSQVLKIRWEDELNKENPLKDNSYSNLTVQQKVEILHNLCDFRLDVADVQDLLKGLDADSLRVEPLGRDAEGDIYWYFYGTRLYKEVPAETAEEKEKRKLKKKKKLAAKKKRRKKKKAKGKKKRKKVSSDSESDFITSSSSEDFTSEEEEDDLDSESEEEKPNTPTWSLVCSTAEEWEELAESFKKSKNRDEKLLYQTLSEDFVPEIGKMIEAKEKAYQKKLLELAPRRASTRIAIKMSLKEDNEMKELDEEEKLRERERQAEEKRLEEEEKQKERDRLAEKRQQERAERARLREERQWMRMNGEFSLESAMPLNGNEERRDEEPVSTREHVPEFDGDDDRDEDLYTGMYKVLDYLKKHNNAWPFLEPVDESYAPQYHEIIESPMDLSTIEEKLDKGEYKKLEQFQDDMQLMFDNCDEYNGPDSMYTKMANTLKAAFERQIKKHFPEDDDNSDEDYEEELRKGKRKEREKEMKGKRRSEFSVNDFIMNRPEAQAANPGMGPGSMPFPFMNEMGMNRVPNPMMGARHPQDFQFPPGVPPGFGPDGRPVYPPQFYQNYYNATMARFNMPQQQQFNPYQYQPPPLTRAPMGDPQRMGFPQQSVEGRMPFQRPSPNGMTPPGLSRMQAPPRLGLPPGATAGPGGMPVRPQMPTGSPMIPEVSQQQPSSQVSSPPSQGQTTASQPSGQPQFPDQFGANPAGLSNRPGGYPMQMPPNHPGSMPNQFPGFPGMNGPPRLQRAQMEQMAQHRMGPYGQNMPPGFGLGPRAQLPQGFMPSSQGPPKSQAAPVTSVPSSIGASSSTLTSPAASDASGDEKKTNEKDAVPSPVPHTTPVSTSGEPTPPSLTAEKEKRESEQAVPMSRPQSFGQPFPQQPYYGRPLAPYPQGMPPQGPAPAPQERQTSVITGLGGPLIAPSETKSEKATPSPGTPKDPGTQAAPPKQERPTNQLMSRPQGTPTPPNVVPKDQMEQAPKNKGVGMSISHILGSPSRDTSSPRQSENRAPVITVSRRSPPPLVSDRKRAGDGKPKSDSNRSSPLVEVPTQPPQERPPSGYKSWPPDQGPNVQGPPRQDSPSMSGGHPRGFLEDLFNGKTPPAKDMEIGDSGALQGPQRLPFTSLLKEIAPQRDSPGKDNPFVQLDSMTSDPQGLSRSLGGMNQAHKDFMTRNYLRGQAEGQRYGPLAKQIGPYGMYPGKMGPESMSPLAYRSQGQGERAMQQLAGKRAPEGQYVDLDAMQYREQPGFPTPEHLFLMEQRHQQERMASSRSSVIGGDSMHMMHYPGNMLRQQQEQQYLQAMYGNRMRNGEFTSSEEPPSSKIPRFS